MSSVKTKHRGGDSASCPSTGKGSHAKQVPGMAGNNGGKMQFAPRSK